MGASNSSESDRLSGWWLTMVLCSIVRSAENPGLSIFAAWVNLFAQKPNPTGSLFTRRARRHALPGHRACCKLLVSVKNLLFGRLASSPPADYKSALVRPRWRVVSTVEVRAGVLP